MACTSGGSKSGIFLVATPLQSYYKALSINLLDASQTSNFIGRVRSSTLIQSLWLPKTGSRSVKTKIKLESEFIYNFWKTERTGLMNWRQMQIKNKQFSGEQSLNSLRYKGSMTYWLQDRWKHDDV